MRIPCSLSVFVAAASLAACAMLPTDSLAPPSGTPLSLASSNFRDGGVLSLRHGGNMKENPECVGENVSPAFTWSNLPAGTRSLAFIVYDPDGRGGAGVVHWVGYGIAPSVTGFAENEISSPSPKYVPGKGTRGLGSYTGPCPPAGTGWHHYNFTLVATDLEPGALPPGLTRDELLARLAGHAKQSATIIGRSGR